MPKNIVIGSHVWVGDPKLVWIDGQIINVNGEEAEIQTSNGKTVSWVHEMLNNLPKLTGIQSYDRLVQLSMIAMFFQSVIHCVQEFLRFEFPLHFQF